MSWPTFETIVAARLTRIVKLNPPEFLPTRPANTTLVASFRWLCDQLSQQVYFELTLFVGTSVIFLHLSSSNEKLFKL